MAYTGRRSLVRDASGSEIDAFDHKHLFRWPSGRRREIKRGFHKRSRKAAKADVERDVQIEKDCFEFWQMPDLEEV